jgi:hypothetical protein
MTASRLLFESETFEREGGDNLRLVVGANFPVNQAHQVKRWENSKAPLNDPLE